MHKLVPLKERMARLEEKLASTNNSDMISNDTHKNSQKWKTKFPYWVQFSMADYHISVMENLSMNISTMGLILGIEVLLLR